jgi:predicted enzyme related to lactoylglutathione lyase
MGGKVIMERTVLPGMVTMAQFEDPAGNVIGLVETEMPHA